MAKKNLGSGGCRGQASLGYGCGCMIGICMLRPFGSRLAFRQLIAACLKGSLLVLPALSLAFEARPAAAEGSAAPDKKELSNARAQFQRAIELEQAGNYSTALEQFRGVGQV